MAFSPENISIPANDLKLYLDRNLSLKLSKEVDRGEARCPRVSQLASSPSVEWPFAAIEDGGGMESLPFRLMMQDCTAVKTLLLKMKRVLQEVRVQMTERLLFFYVNGDGKYQN